jgi:Organic Anion Transporter Polypeptide (OATP) family
MITELLIIFFSFAQLATKDIAECEIDGGNLMPQIFLFIAQLIAGVGQTLCGTLGVSYMDDNIKRSKMPALMSI